MNRALLAGVAAAAVVAWLATGALPWPARLWTTMLLSVLPALAAAQARLQVEAQAIPRSALYLSSAFGIWALAALTALVAWASGWTPQRLGLAWTAPAETALWGAGATLAGLGIQAAWRAAGTEETALLAHLLPRTAAERIAFVGLSLSAGIGEELVFRGFLISALDTATGSLWLAVLLSSGAFGVLHAYQGGAGALRAGLLGGVLALPLVFTGSVVPSMAAHAALNLIAGLWLADWLLRR